MTKEELYVKLSKDKNYFYLNGLKARSSKVFEVPILINDPVGFPGFYTESKGPLETNIQFKEFASSVDFKNIMVDFEELKA